MKKGIDIAKWNVISDYSKLKKAGVDFAIVKVINSSNKSDSLFETHVDGCNDAGIEVIGGYTYTYANSTAKAAVASKAFIQTASNKDIKFLWLDIEDSCMKGLGSLVVDIINVYKNTAKDAGLDFGIYTGASFYTSYLKPYISKLQNIPFWIARYPYTKDYSISDAIPDTKYLPGGIDIDGWQYSSKLKVDGAKGYLDLDVWYEDTAFKSTNKDVNVLTNPFTEPTQTVTKGTMGNDANWVLWYLWRFNMLKNTSGEADSALIDGIISASDYLLIIQAQKILGLTADGKVGKVTRAAFSKVWAEAVAKLN